MEPPDRLESWKEIAAYLKRDVRTVQRWESGEQLPVHRHTHQKRGSVYAYPAELDAWRNSRHAVLLLSDSADAEAPAAEDQGRPIGEAADDRGGAWRWFLPAAGLLAIIGVTSMLIRQLNTDRAAAGETVELDAPRLFGEAMRDGGTLDRIPIGGKAGYLALSPDGGTLFVSICDVDTPGFQAIDLRTRKVAWSVRSLKGCGPLVVSASGHWLFLSDGADVVVADIATRAIRRISTPTGRIADIALARDDHTLYVAAIFSGLLTVDTRSGEITTISRIPCPVWLALTPARDRLYVNYQCSGPGGRRGHDAIEVFDTDTNSSIAVIKDLPNVGGTMVVSPDGSQLWADGHDACRSASYDHAGCPAGPGSVVNVVRTLDHTLIRSLTIGHEQDFNLRLAITPDGTRVVAGSKRTMVVSAATLNVVETSALPMGHMLFAPDGRMAYAILGELSSIAVLPIAEFPAPPPGLTARWTFDGVGTDLAGGNDLGSFSSESFAPGRRGFAIGITQASPIRLESPSLLDLERGPMTAAAWVRFEASGMVKPVIEYAATSSDGVYGWTLQVGADGRAAMCLGWFEGNRCDPSKSATVQGATVLEPSRWYHVSFTRGRETLTLYVDGREEGTAQVNGVALEPLTSWLRLGSAESGSLMSGRLDEVEVYGRALTAEEVAQRAR